MLLLKSQLQEMEVHSAEWGLSRVIVKITSINDTTIPGPKCQNFRKIPKTATITKKEYSI
jgi:hypothetical protein